MGIVSAKFPVARRDVGQGGIFYKFLLMKRSWLCEGDSSWGAIENYHSPVKPGQTSWPTDKWSGCFLTDPEVCGVVNFYKKVIHQSTILLARISSYFYLILI